MRVLTDADVAAVTPRVAVGAAREALRQAGTGTLAAPPRAISDLGDLSYVFTTGALADGASGFRVYRAGAPQGDQFTAVWDPSGTLLGLVVGAELGARRTGALGAVAADLLARPSASTVAVIGAGAQAWTQLWALTAVRALSRVRVFARTPAHRDRFAARAVAELGVPAVAVGDPSTAVRDADIVVLATRSQTPVISAADVAPGTHVTTVGPKWSGRHEAPLGLLDRASVLASDSPAQAAGYPDPFFTPPSSLVALGDILVGTRPGRRSDTDITVFCSVGLAGSEVLLAQSLLSR